MNEPHEHQDQSAPPSPAMDTSHVPPASTSKKHRRLWIGIACCGVLVLLALLVMWRSETAKPDNALDQTPPPTVRTASAKRGDIGQYVEAIGTVTPISTVNVYPQITGRVTAVHYSEGQMVRKGDPLIDIDSRPYEAQLAEAEGTLEHDRGVLTQAQIDLARYKDASSNGAVSRQIYEDQQQTVVQDQGTVKNDIGEVQYAQVQLSYCHIASPITGRVGLRLVDPGNTIFSGSSNALVVIAQLQPITVVFNVAEDNLSRVHDQIRHRGNLPVDAYDRTQLNKIATGKLLTLDNQIDTTTGTVRFRAQFNNSALTLYPNQFVNAKLLVHTLRDVTLIPSAAIQHDGVNAFVYRVNGQIVKIAPVREDTSDSDISAVEGIQPGDVVVTSGFDKLQDGTKIHIQGANPGSADLQQDGGSH